VIAGGVGALAALWLLASPVRRLAHLPGSPDLVPHPP
jgi:hypothetical protein